MKFVFVFVNCMMMIEMGARLEEIWTRVAFRYVLIVFVFVFMCICTFICICICIRICFSFCICMMMIQMEARLEEISTRVAVTGEKCNN